MLTRTASGSGSRSLAVSAAAAPPRERSAAARNIGLFGLFGCGNSGNDGSLEAMLLFLRRVRPEAELICFSAPSYEAADQIAREFRIPTVPLGFPKPAAAWLRGLDRILLSAPRQLASLICAIRHVRQLELLTIPGTGILDDFEGRPLGMPLAILAWCLAARLCGTRLAFVSIGAGPIEHPVSRWLMKTAAAMADYRSYRDTASKEFMESIGFDTSHDPIYPDIAFKLPAPALTRQRQADPSLIVGVGVMTYQGWRNSRRSPLIYAAYVEKISQFIVWLLNQGHRVRILMGETGDRRAVADVSAKVAAALPELPHGRLLVSPMRSLHDLMDQIAETDIVVASRFHNVVCALKLGKPTVSIGYARKNDVLMAEMGVGSFCQQIESLDLNLLIEQFTRLLTDRQRYGQYIRDANRRYQEQLDRQDLLFASRFL
jgi:polysaccharide pyruvyl transferase WcaK-like protein